jgi:hypothetical protein
VELVLDVCQVVRRSGRSACPSGARLGLAGEPGAVTPVAFGRVRSLHLGGTGLRAGLAEGGGPAAGCSAAGVLGESLHDFVPVRLDRFAEAVEDTVQ